MVDVDAKDRKILYELDLNCRQSNAQIARRVGLSKEVTTYRIKRMEEEGIITGYWTAINTFKLGYYVFRVYINFIDVTPKVKSEIIKYFMDNEDAWAVITSKGPLDLDVVLWVKDVYAFNRYWINTLQLYDQYFAQSTVSILTHVMACKKSYLIDEPVPDREFYQTSCEGSWVQIDQLDYRILDALVLHARMPLLELAKRFHSSSQTMQYRIKRLREKNIIQAFRVGINPTKFGLQETAVNLFLKNQSMRTMILGFLKEKPNVYDIIIMNVGWGDLSFQAYVKDHNELSKLIDDLEVAFPNAIRKYLIWVDPVTQKERWLPKMDFKQ